MKISVFGRVLAPGEFPYYENATLRDMLFLAKGFQEDANTQKIEVVRTIKDSEMLKKGDIKTETYQGAPGRYLQGHGHELGLVV